MEKRIYKYRLPVDDRPAVMMPQGARILAVQAQRDNICIWAVVDPNAEQETRRFAVIGTGHPFSDAERMAYLGTVQMLDGSLIFHVFEVQ